MSSTSASCRYCGGEISAAQQRCRACGSWLTWGGFLSNPDTIWSQLGALMTIAAAVFAWLHAMEARADRMAAEALRRDLGTVAEHVTKLSIVVADASSRTDGMTEAHAQRIARERDALLPFLSATFGGEVRQLLADLEDGRPPRAAAER